LKNSSAFTETLAAAAAPFAVRRLGADDLADYKALRDTMLLLAPDAFTADPQSEWPKAAEVYQARFGLGGDDPATFTLGALSGDRLVGAISCEHESLPKVAHIGHIVGMMVLPEHGGRGVGRALLRGCIDRVRTVTTLEQLLLTVTATNPRAIALYEAAGFVRYGTLTQALRLDEGDVDKHLLRLMLAAH
jgi:ribosomal protein S18 acetylase RimI-like enzyme